MEPILKNSCNAMPRTEYPSPIWKRTEWYCLNGAWEFAYDFGRSGEARGMVNEGEFPLKITVPFCPESKLSGIGNTDFMPAVWYRRTLNVDEFPQGRALLHFGAVDFFTKVWVNGVFVGSHKGGYSSFVFDITHALLQGENVIVVYAEDDLRSRMQVCGKQCDQYKSRESSYTRTTGIWQTVWLEFVSQKYLVSSRNTPHAADGCLDLHVKAFQAERGDTARVSAFYKGRKVGQTEAKFVGEVAQARLFVDEVHLWDVGKPEIYDLTIELIDRNGDVLDRVESYFALRDVSFDKKSLKINGKPVFMRLILDQGFNPDGVYTAPDAAFLKKDIELSMRLGFNGARLHQRIFEPYTLYYADMLGYIVWVESPISIRSHIENLDIMENYIPEWMDIVEKHYNYPSVVGWCIFNESYHWMKINAYSHKWFYALTKQMDAYRPVIDASGGVHYETDMFDTHDYEQDPQRLKAHYEKMLEDENTFYTAAPNYRGNAPYRADTYSGQAFWVSEYGGTFWNPKVVKEGAKGWGYGSLPQTEEEFAARYEGLTDVLLSHPRVCGFAYTQLTDIEQEQNGLYYDDRTPKFNDVVYARIRAANQMKAAIEEK